VVVEVFAAVEEVELQLEEDEEGSEEVLAEVEVSLFSTADTTLSPIFNIQAVPVQENLVI